MKSNNYAELQDEKCFGCKFCVWEENEQREVSEIKGCWNNSKYIEFK